ENICAELNTPSHSWPQVRAPFNQSIFGAAFYTSALLHLMRGGADAEMFWTGTDQDAGYGMLDGDANPTPVFHAKRLCAQYVRTGDWISFPAWEQSRAGEVDAVVARDEKGRRSVLLVHRRDEVATYAVSQLDGDLADCRLLLKIDGATGNRVTKANHDGTITFHGFGVAVMTNSPSRTDEPS